MKKRNLLIGIIALFSATSIMACGHKTPAEKSEWIQKKAAKKLELNEDQKTKLKDLADTFLASRAKMKADREQTYDQIQKLLVSDNVESKNFTDLVEPKMQIFEENLPIVADKLAVFHNSLNPEQKQKLAKFTQKIKEKMDRRYN